MDRCVFFCETDCVQSAAALVTNCFNRMVFDLQYQWMMCMCVRIYCTQFVCLRARARVCVCVLYVCCVCARAYEYV